MPHLLKLAAVIVIATSIAGCASTYDTPPKSITTVTAQTDAAETKSMMADDTTTSTSTSTSSGVNIMETANAAENLTTLAALLNQAGLAETLSGPGSFTVFAPSDTAFSLLPEATREGLKTDANRAKLQNILKNHVLPSRLTADDLLFNIERNGGSFKTTTIEGVELRFFASGDTVKMSDGRGYVSTVTTADLDQSNGVIHIINSVLLPE